MPGQISLDDSSFEELYGQAMERLRRQAPWWTHTEVSDPGIMLVEMWAMLTDMQSFYLDQVQESHYRKYLKLLGIRPEEGECARTWVFFEQVGEERTVPGGTKLLADGLVFETEEEVRLAKNDLVGFYLESGRNLIRKMKLSRKSSFALGQGEQLFSFALEEPPAPGKIFSFFVLMKEYPKRRRDERDFWLVRLGWEYRTKEGWREAQVVRDDTRGLLYSGLICLRMDIPMSGEGENGYEIRCLVREGDFDVRPVLYKLYLNAAAVVQRDTLCCREEFLFTKDVHRVALQSYLARTGRLWILRKRTDGPGTEDGELWEDITDSPHIRLDPPVTAECPERYLTYAGEGQVRVVCSDARIVPEELVREVTGISSQQITMPWNNRVLRSGTEIMLGQGGKGLYRRCRRAEPEEDRYGNAWHWKDGETVIVLGDGRHGEIPPPSVDGLHFVSLVLWEGEKGNVAVGRITGWERPELFPGIVCLNRLPAGGGRDWKSPSEQFREAGKQLSDSGRMITGADMEILAMRTPGLLLTKAHAGWKDGVLEVTLTPQNKLSSYCEECYRRQAERYLEQYRIAGTRMRIEIGKE
ncbi:MAG: hypothetical protein OSJ69_01590 [Acetatifactor sp.]|nr:hypothetical protein [Acetatifactor sp.]